MTVEKKRVQERRDIKRKRKIRGRHYREKNGGR